MLIRVKQFVFILFIFFISNKIYSQPGSDIIIKQDFVPVLDSLIIPPSDCEDAYKLVMYDSTADKFIFVSLLDDQDQRIQKLFDELTTDVKNNKYDRNKEQKPPSGSGPPQGNSPPGGHMGPPGGFGNTGQDMEDLREDIHDANIALDKIEVQREKYKNELSDMQTKVNEKLHKTLEADHDAHILILNEFMKYAKDLYKQYKPVFRDNMKVLDNIITKYYYGDKLKFPPLKSEIQKLQLAEVTNLKFLLNITKEFVTTGANFYNEKVKDTK